MQAQFVLALAGLKRVRPASRTIRRTVASPSSTGFARDARIDS